jgi:hypothetical protein
MKVSLLLTNDDIPNTDGFDVTSFLCNSRKLFAALFFYSSAIYYLSFSSLQHILEVNLTIFWILLLCFFVTALSVTVGKRLLSRG